MHEPAYTINTLFAQLGLEGTDAAVDHFIRTHGPLPATVQLHEAPCWSPAQAKLLKEAVVNDADWAEVVDQLDALLRKTD
jgi:hypothetical protein